MKAVRSRSDIITEARQQEQNDQLEAAADLYEQLLAANPLEGEALGRLLVVYRRLKAYPRELAVIDNALEAMTARDKTSRQQWLAAHPGAAKLGKEVLHSLGGETLTGFGADPLAAQLQKRKAVVEKRMGANGAKRKSAPKTRPSSKARAKGAAQKAPRQRTESPRQRTESPRKDAGTARQRADAERRRATAEQKRAESERKRVAAAAKKAAAKEAAESRKHAAEAHRLAAEERRREAKEAAAKKAAAAKEAADAKAAVADQPSLFIISLRYLVPLEKIDAAMKKHMAWLGKHVRSGRFLVAGRQVPRSGGIIIARGKDRAAIEKIAAQDPFIKGKLASADIIEFKRDTR